MRVLVTGGPTGQLKLELEKNRPSNIEIVNEGVQRLDITDAEAVRSLVEQSRPQSIINAAAYTSVDRAESDPDSAFSVNRQGVINLAQAADEFDSRLIHISTESVFGAGVGAPFQTGGDRNPLSVYGKSKLEGEQCLVEMLPEQHLIIRTSWVYSSFGSNFVKTMLDLMKVRSEIGVVADQVGSPTWANRLAQAIWRAEAINATGILHWTGAGIASWYDFAQAIFEEASALKLLNNPMTVKPLRSDQYPSPAQRPHYGVLDTTTTQEILDLPAVHWREELRLMLRELV